jgi:phytoene dehydrogenase-like protein
MSSKAGARSARPRYDAVVVGSGPNGLAAAITLARGLAPQSVLLIEASPTIGGGTRTAELTLPGFRHDVCSAVHPFALASPFLKTLPLTEHGLELIHSPAPLAHPLDDGRTAMLERSIEETGRTLGRDASAYGRLMEPFIDRADDLFADLIGPLKPPRHPILAARFGLRAIQPATRLARDWFEDEPARALLAGLAAHSILPLDYWATSAIGLVLGLAGHAVGWPIVRGGSQRLAESLASYFRSLRGEVWNPATDSEEERPCEIATDWRVESLDELPPARVVLLDVTPRQVVRMAGHRLPARYVRRLQRFRYGAGVFKLDWALSGPIPWRSAECARAGTVHLGATLDELAASEAAVGRGEHPERPFVLLSQPSLFDPSRAPAGRHTAWAYCHVPNGSTVDMTSRIEAQVERFAPGFRDLILARHAMEPSDFERYNPNYIGGDINGGAQDLRQLFTRPVARLIPYSTPLKGLYICSSSTPPGGGVHGLCGYYAARAALGPEEWIPPEFRMK